MRLDERAPDYHQALGELSGAIQRMALLQALPRPDAEAEAGARARNGQLTKPPGALGRLEDLAIWYAGWRGVARPSLVRPQVIVFAGNHGVTARGV